MPNLPWRPCAFAFLVALAGLVAFTAAPLRSQTNPNERMVKSLPSEFDKVGVSGMDFIWKDPRIIRVKLPARGERICWYLWYQVINHSGKPFDFVPYFEVVTLDNPGAYHDEILITAEEAIKKIEDPTGYQEIKNTIRMSEFAIPPSKPLDEAFPRKITGVAIWDAGPVDPTKRDPKFKELSDTTRFSIFVRGLSNGFVETDSPVPGLPSITKYKTLQLNFKRKGDRFSTDSRDIEFVSPAQWIYRSAARTIPKVQKADEKDK